MEEQQPGAPHTAATGVAPEERLPEGPERRAQAQACSRRTSADRQQEVSASYGAVTRKI